MSGGASSRAVVIMKIPIVTTLGAVPIALTLRAASETRRVKPLLSSFTGRFRRYITQIVTLEKIPLRK